MTYSTEQVWSLMSSDIERFIRRRVTDSNVAADILQNTFMRIHSKIDTLRDADRLAPWVYRIARNAIIDHLRGTRSLKSIDINDLGEADDDMSNFNHTVGGWLSEMIAGLPEGYREVMELTEREGLTHQAVSDRLGLSLSGVKSRVQRGRAMLRQMVLDCCHVDLDRFGNVVDYAKHGGCDACCRRTS